MRTITTRELVHHAREIRESLERGESFQWSQRGRVVAILQPTASAPTPIDWVKRACEAGVVPRSKQAVSDLVAEARGE